MGLGKGNEMKNLIKMLKLLFIHESEEQRIPIEMNVHNACYDCYMYSVSESDSFMQTIVKPSRLSHIKQSFIDFCSMLDYNGKGIFKTGVLTGYIQKPYLIQFARECDICFYPLPKKPTERYEIEFF